MSSHVRSEGRIIESRSCPGREKMNRLRTGLLALLAVFVLIVVLQNTGPVDTRLLFVTVSLPRAVLLISTLIIGFLLGLVAASWRRKERGKGTES